MKYTCLPLFATMILFFGCTSSSPPADNPLLVEWDTPFGVPPFDRILDSDYLPAINEAIEEESLEVRTIAESQELATFENTIEALERSGKTLRRVENVFFAVHSANSTDETRETASAIAPKLSAHYDDIHLNPSLFERVESVYADRVNIDTDAEGQRLLEETYKSFVRGGALLDTEEKGRMREINSELAKLTESFSQNLLAETNAFTVHLTDPASLGDIPKGLVEAAAEEAKNQGYDDGWLFTLSRPSINPFLQYSPDREARQIGRAHV